MNLHLDRALESLPDHEPFCIGARESAAIKRALIEENDLDLHRKSTLSAFLPPANMGEYAWDLITTEAEEIIEQSKQFITDTKVYKTEINISLTNFSIKGFIHSHIGSDAYVFINPVKTTPSHLLKTWLLHTMLNCVDCGKKSLFIDKECKITTFLPIESPMLLLEQLKAVLDRAYTEPLPFSPATSLRFAEAILQKKLNIKKAISQAEDEWQKEGDTYLNYIWSRKSILNHKHFSSLACQIYEPFLESIEAKKR
jgi:hypothetical protein